MKRPAVAFFLLLAVSFSAWAVWFFWPPDVKALKTFNPARTRMMEIRMMQAKAAGRPYKIHQTWVPLERISPHLRHAVLVSEDARFHQHRGVDWTSLRNSVRQNILRRRFAFGGSTITQQVAKNLYLTPRKTPLRKLKEIEIALLMERSLSKRRIMEIYLNVIEWGDGIFGAEAASWAFFGKPAADLSPEEAASLAAVVPSPRRHSPTGGSRFALRRKEWVLKWMGRSGYLPVPEPEVPVAPPVPADWFDASREEEPREEEGDPEEIPVEQVPVEPEAEKTGIAEPSKPSVQDEFAPEPDTATISAPVQ